MDFLFPLLVLAAPVAELEVAPVASSSTTELSIHVGAGYSDAPVGLVRPRLSYSRARFALTIGAPLVVGQGRLFDSAESYVAWLETLDLDLEAVALRVAPLVDYGEGLSVDGLTSRLGPTDLRNAVAVAWRGEDHTLELFSDGVLDPRVFGARWDWTLLTGKTTQIRAVSTGALDPRAPGSAGPSTVGAADVMIDLEQGIVSGFSIGLRTGAGALFRSDPLAFGGHASLSARIGPVDRRLTLEGGTRRVGEGYIGSYFDRLYASERDGFRGTAKADLEQFSGWVARGALAAKVDGLSLSLAAEQGALPGALRLEAELGLQDDDWQLRALAAQRAVARTDDIGTLGDTSYVSVDFAHRLWRSLFAFATVNHRVVDSEVVREGFAGIGFGQTVR